ncbi:MAG: GTP-binding protein [Betaproteobacteria bacterium]|nr:GTP-binding protein [Betaproteobacteria bacterium]
MTWSRDVLAGKIPVTLVTGFLGSGKTTLISKLLLHPDMRRVAVVINEIGEIGIDHDLVTMSSENITLLANGCICCSVRTDLQETLRDLFAQRRVGEVFDFDRVIVETTGLADPAPVVQTLTSDTLLAAHYRLDGLITLVDGLHGVGQIDQQTEAVKQIAIADKILVTKTDLTSVDHLETLCGRIRQLNAQSPIEFIRQGEVDPKRLIDLGLSSSRASLKTLQFLGESLTDSAVSADGAGRYLGQRSAAHNAAVKTLSLRFTEPFEWLSFSSALELLTTLRGPDLLRIKGIVNVDGYPVVVQGVQHIIETPVKMDRWPSDDKDSRLVFIVRNMELDVIRNLFQAVGAIKSSFNSST